METFDFEGKSAFKFSVCAKVKKYPVYFNNFEIFLSMNLFHTMNLSCLTSHKRAYLLFNVTAILYTDTGWIYWTVLFFPCQINVKIVVSHLVRIFLIMGLLIYDLWWSNCLLFKMMNKKHQIKYTMKSGKHLGFICLQFKVHTKICCAYELEQIYARTVIWVQRVLVRTQEDEQVILLKVFKTDIWRKFNNSPIIE